MATKFLIDDEGSFLLVEPGTILLVEGDPPAFAFHVVDVAVRNRIARPIRSDTVHVTAMQLPSVASSNRVVRVPPRGAS